MEVLIGLTLGLVVLAVLGQVYSASKRSYLLQQSIARMQEAGRYAISALSTDVRQAGYFGLTDIRATAALGKLSGAVTPAANCDSSNNNWGRMVTQALFGLDDSNTAYASCIPNGDYIQGDILTMRYAASEHTTVYHNKLYLRSAPYEAAVFLGDPSTDPGAQAITVPATQDHPLIAHAYYVGYARDSNSNRRRCNGYTIPALFRETLKTGGKSQREEVVSGVEDLQIRYGLDNSGDGSVNTYLDAATITDWSSVIAVRAWVLVRDECPDPSYHNTGSYTLGDQSYGVDDHFHRTLYSATVTLRNPN